MTLCFLTLCALVGSEKVFNMAHTFCMLDYYGKNTDTHSEYVICTACPQQPVTWRCHNITLYTHCSSWSVGHWLLASSR